MVVDHGNTGRIIFASIIGFGPEAHIVLIEAAHLRMWVHLGLPMPEGKMAVTPPEIGASDPPVVV